MLDQYEEGRKAHADGKARHENPHAVDTEDWALWMDGFDQAATEATYRSGQAVR